MFFRHAHNDHLWMLEQLAEPLARCAADGFASERLAPRVDHRLTRDCRGYHRGEYAHRAVLPGARANGDRRPIVVHVGAGPELGYPVHLVRAPERRRRATTHDA